MQKVCLSVQKVQEETGGVIGKFLNPAAAAKKNMKRRVGGATMRAMGPALSSTDSDTSSWMSSVDSSASSKSSRDGSNGSGSGRGESQAADEKKAPAGGLRALFGRK